MRKCLPTIRGHKIFKASKQDLADFPRTLCPNTLIETFWQLFSQFGSGVDCRIPPICFGVRVCGTVV